MRRFLIIFSGGLIAGLGTAVLAIIVARHARPFYIDSTDGVDALTVALGSALAHEVESRPNELYIRSAFSDELLPNLRQLYPETQFRDWKERPPDNGCESSDPNVLVMGPCQRPDYLSADIKATPLWHTFIVGVGFYNGGCEMILFNASKKWRMVSKQCFFI